MVVFAVFASMKQPCPTLLVCRRRRDVSCDDWGVQVGRTIEAARS